jgi:saccharopine dehydrogenase (NADP+, L-glutamate forming)
MQTVLIAGAGKSSSALIEYMLHNARRKWKVVVMDSSAEMIAEKLNGHPKGEGVVVDIHNEKQRQKLVQDSDIVISMMPHALHIILAKDCIKFKKNLITASYVSSEMKAMDEEARKAGVLFMCEMGLDPGIDHMSASSLMNSIHRIAGIVKSFKSTCGGLVAPESDDNPWHYKISWNPQNIVLAGKEGAVWLENGKTHELEYKEIFSNSRKVVINGIGNLAAYPNRDSMKYLALYDLDEVKTFSRTTLRYPQFIKGWNIIVKAGLTDETDKFNVAETTFADWIASKTGAENDDTLRQNFKKKLNVEDKEMKLLEWLRIFENRQINANGFCSSAEILQTLLEERWKMKPLDKDMVLMQHQLEYERRGVTTKLTATLKLEGENRQNSAMAKCVGLPMAILAKKILLGEINVAKLTGVKIPTQPEIYVPVLKELKKYGVEFTEEIE